MKCVVSLSNFSYFLDTCTETDSDAEEGSKSADPRLESDDEADALPVYLYKPQSTQKMGDWEKHTKVD